MIVYSSKENKAHYSIGSRMENMEQNDEDTTGLPWRVRLFVYLMHGFTSLGARMWWFGTGMFLIRVTPDSLQLTAIYGFTNGGALLLLSPVIGDLVDKSQRLKAARVALIANNIMIMACCVVVYLVLNFKEQIQSFYANDVLLRICFALIIFIIIATNLAFLGRTLILGRDWIVEICRRNQNHIATMGASLRVIDLCAKVVAPLATGQVMTYASVTNGVIFIACWNFVSLVAEYFIIRELYNLVPALHYKGKGGSVTDEEKGIPATQELTEIKKDNSSISAPSNSTHGLNEPSEKHVDFQTTNKNTGIISKFFRNILAVYRGWNHFRKYDVASAGVALAFLYFTVLGFDNITIGYAVTQGMTESVLSIMIGCAAIIGIIASVSYPFIRRRIGLVRTGQLGLSCEITALSLCILSLWMPGSTFDPYYWSRDHDQMTRNTSACVQSNTSSSSNYDNTTLISIGCNMTSSIPNGVIDKPMTSLVLLYAGIVAARFGVWTADLAITQLFLESVKEQERGIVNGFQSCLNSLMDMLKFVMVMFLPEPETFGFPAIISFSFICFAWLLYARYMHRAYGRIFC